MNYQYSLDRSSKKFTCPMCRAKSFVRYIEIDSKDYLPEEVGRCDRENRCGHHFTPKQYFAEHPDRKPDQKVFIDTKEPEPQKPVSFYPLEYAEKSFNKVYDTNLAKFLNTLFDKRTTAEALKLYMMGRSIRIDNGTAAVFWEWDIDQNLRSGKVVCYEPVTGKRKKGDPQFDPRKVHGLQPFRSEQPAFNYRGCFFGEHLLNEFPEKEVSIVESEKTAIIASVILPQYNWLATGGASGCKWREYETYKVLKNKKVRLFPDYGFYNHKTQRTCYTEWCERADRIREAIGCDIWVSRIFEDRQQAFFSGNKLRRDDDIDLADVLIYDLKQEIKP